MLGVHIDEKLNFNLHITKICRSLVNQPLSLIEEQKTLINSYFYSNCNYCLFLSIFSSAKSLNKVEPLQQRALRFLYEDYVSLYELLLEARQGSMKGNRLRCFYIELYRLVNNINTMYMNDVFKLKKIRKAIRSNYKHNLDVPTINQFSFGDKSLRCYGPKIWNPLPFHIKSSEKLEEFNEIIKKWNGLSCKCKVCQYH